MFSCRGTWVELFPACQRQRMLIMFPKWSSIRRLRMSLVKSSHIWGNLPPKALDRPVSCITDRENQNIYAASISEQWVTAEVPGCNNSIWNGMCCMLLAQWFEHWYQCYIFFIGHGHPRYWTSTCLWHTWYSGPVLPGVLWTCCISPIHKFTVLLPLCYCVALWPCWSKWATIKSPPVLRKTTEIQRSVTAIILQRKRKLSSTNSCAWDWEFRVTSAEQHLLWRMHMGTVSAF